MKAKAGDTVSVSYVGRLPDGTVFDATDDEHPLEFSLGKCEVIKGFEAAVTGMEVGEEKEVTIPQEEAYGERKELLLMKVPKEKIPPGAKVGMRIGITSPDGRSFPGMLTDLSETEATLDFNHPLAGKTLKFKVKLVKIAE